MSRTPIIGTLAAVIVIGMFSYLFTVREVSAPQAGKLQVAASFYPLAFFASEIGGDKVDVFTVTPSGAEPHDYEPTVQDVIRIQESRLLILNGDDLEPWAGRVKQNIDPNQTRVVTAGEGLPTRTVTENGTPVIDPHVWLSPPLAEQMVQKIAEGLAAADPANATYYNANEKALVSKLKALDTEYRNGLTQCALTDVVTSHAAFGYLARAYGLTQIPIAGLSPDTEPSPIKLANIADLAKRKNVRVIFFGSLVSPKLAKTVANEIGARTMVLDPIEGLSEHDRMAGEDYFTKMRQNLANLRTALQCQP